MDRWNNGRSAEPVPLQANLRNEESYQPANKLHHAWRRGITFGKLILDRGCVWCGKSMLSETSQPPLIPKNRTNAWHQLPKVVSRGYMYVWLPAAAMRWPPHTGSDTWHVLVYVCTNPLRSSLWCYGSTCITRVHLDPLGGSGDHRRP